MGGSSKKKAKRKSRGGSEDAGHGSAMATPTPSRTSSASKMEVASPQGRRSLGLVALRVEKVVRGWNKGLSRENSVLISPSTCASLGLSVGGMCLLQTMAATTPRRIQRQRDHTEAETSEPIKAQWETCRVWVSKTVAANAVRVQLYGLSADSLLEDTFVRLHRLSADVLSAMALKAECIVDPAPSIFSADSERTQTKATLDYIQQCLVGFHVTEGARVSVAVGGASRVFKLFDVVAHVGRVSEVSVDSTGAPQVYLLGDNTVVEFVESKDAQSDEVPTDPPTTDATANLGAIGGLQKELDVILEMVRLPLLTPEVYTRYGLKPPKGVLLFGPPGTGKTMIARAVASQNIATFFSISGPEIVSKYVGESEQRLRDLFRRAEQKAPSVIFIDEIDALCPSRDRATEEMQKRIVATMLTLMDGMVAQDRVVVLAATNRPESLDSALRRPGRFDKEIEIGIPTSAGRLDILTRMLEHMTHSLSAENVQFIASQAHGYVGADLKALCNEAAMNTIARAQLDAAKEPGAAEIELKSGVPATDDLKSLTFDVDSIRISFEDMRKALSQVRPSAMREVAVDVPTTRWEDIGGQALVKQKLKEAVEWPLKHPEAFERMGITPPKAILLYGPPGCSKTLLAKALANESSRNFIAVKGPELFSKWVGESEKAVRELFRKARAASPSILFFDEIDSIAGHRGSGGGGGGDRVADRVLSQLLIEMDGIERLKDVTILAATNRPDMIDSALMRPGRIDRVLYVAPPDQESARSIYRICTSKMATAPDVDCDVLGDIAWKSGLSGAEIAASCKNAAVLAMEENVNADYVFMRHLEAATRAFQPRITPEMLQFYAEYQQSAGLKNV